MVSSLLLGVPGKLRTCTRTPTIRLTRAQAHAAIHYTTPSRINFFRIVPRVRVSPTGPLRPAIKRHAFGTSYTRVVYVCPAYCLSFRVCVPCWSYRTYGTARAYACADAPPFPTGLIEIEDDLGGLTHTQYSRVHDVVANNMCGARGRIEKRME